MEKMVNAMKIVGFPVDNSVLKKITDTRRQYKLQSIFRLFQKTNDI